MAAINFPTSPSNGDKFSGFYYDSTLVAWKRITANAASPIPSGATPPAGPDAGELWWNSETGVLYIYYTDTDTSQWVEASGTILSSNQLSGLEDVALVSPIIGQALVYNGTSWVNGASAGGFETNFLLMGA